MIGNTDAQTSYRMDAYEAAICETVKSFHVVCAFFRDFIQQNHVTGIMPFRSYAGLIEVYDLVERFMGCDVAAIATEAIIALSFPDEVALIQNLLCMIVYDDPNDERTALKRLTIFTCVLESIKRYRESKDEENKNKQTLPAFYADVFEKIELADMNKMDEMLAAIRDEDVYRWYLKNVIYPLVMQKHDNSVFETGNSKDDSWEVIWDRLKQVPVIGDDDEIIGQKKYTLDNADTIQMILNDARSQFFSGSLQFYHPMWLFGNGLYWSVLYDYLNSFQRDFELYQMKQMRMGA
ncbi:MAG: hypothetical protein IKR11_13140 [Solobacterium sp.]|nr:hypothetical protein [Solobacterium sp.]